MYTLNNESTNRPDGLLRNALVAALPSPLLPEEVLPAMVEMIPEDIVIYAMQMYGYTCVC